MNRHLHIAFFFIIHLAFAAKAQYILDEPLVGQIAYSSYSSLACDVSVDAGADITICEDDLPVQLNGSYTGDALNFSWSPAGNVSDPSILNPIANATGTYTLSVNAIDDQNLIGNGDFEQGNTGFTSQYTTGIANFGNYLVTDNPQNYFNLLSPCTDHTSGSGNMMVVDGGIIQGQDIWCQTITLNPNTDYYLSLWATMVGDFNSPELFFTVNGTSVSTPTAIPLANCLWTEISQIWNSGNNTTAEICVENNNISSFGNDFAIDDIFVSSICEVTDEVEVSFLEVTAVAANEVIPCPGDCVTLDGTNSTQGSGVTYQWTTVSGGTIQNANSLMPTVCEPGTYQLEVVSTSNNLACSETVSVQVTNASNTPVEVNPSVGEISCFDACDGVLTAIGSGGTFPYNFSWANNLGTADNLSNLCEGTYTVTITDGNGCTASTTTTLNNPIQVTADFTVPENICVSDVATVSYQGNASANAIYTWDFAGGNIISGNGIGPYDIQWADAGNYNITLTVEENGCTSAIFSQEIQVDPLLEVPTVTCNSTTQSVVFSWENLPNVNDFIVTDVTGPAGIQNGNTYEVSGLNINETITIALTAVSDNACDDVTVEASCTTNDCPNINVAIDPVGAICFLPNINPFDLTASITGGNNGIATWSGNGITDEVVGTFDPQLAGVGSHEITLTYEQDNCTFTDNVVIDIFGIPDPSFEVTDTICVNNFATITYLGSASANAIYTWDFAGGNIISGNGIGPYDIQWADAGNYNITLTVEENGCTSAIFSQEIQVDPLLEVPTVTCNSTTQSVVFSWENLPNVNDFIVTDVTGPAGIQNGNTYEVSGLNINETITIALTAVSNNACDDVTVEASCTTNDCPNINVAIDPVGAICFSPNINPFDLTASITGGNNGIATWSGNGIIDEVVGTFDPQLAGVSSHEITLTYEQDNCTFTDNVVIDIFGIPDPSFEVTDTICVNNFATITYLGNASANAIYTWDFAGGNIISGNGSGPYDIQWADAGNYNITLTVEENGCTSAIFSQEIQVDPLLDVPTVTCNSTTQSVVFSWENLPNVNDFIVTDVTGPAGIQNGNTYEVSGLNINETITIALTAVSDNACDDVTVEASCTTNDCPNINVAIDPVSPICFSPNINPFDLTASITGGNNGIATWSGNGITDEVVGTFDPQLAGVGSHEITLTYEQDNCTFTDNVVIDIFGIPDPSFEVTDTICVNNFATITYLGSASANAIYTWDFAGGNIISGNGSGPYDIQWADAGNYNITLTVEENGCTSTTFSENIQIDDELEVPIISCLSTTSTVTFSWADVVGATDYQVNELMGSGGVLNGNSYAFTNLSPGEAVSVEIVASGNTICGSSQSAAACSANDCPIIDLAIAPMADVCLGAQTSDLPLEVIVMGSDGSGVGEWSGNGVIGNNFDPQIAGVGSHEITYTFTEIQCVFSASVFINVFLQPVVDAGIGGTLTCDLTTITLNGTNSSSFGNVIWNTTDGNIVGNNNTLTPVVNAAGTYQLVVENSGCTASDEVTIIQDITLPVADAGTEKTITCTQNCVTIGGNNTSTGNDLTYLWTGGNNFTSNELTPTVCQAGDYQLVVYDNSNGCFSPPATVAVSENLTPPVATIESTGNLDCSTAGVILDASNSSATGGMTLQWRNDDGEILGVNNDTYEATTAGKYYLYVVDTINGCEAVDSTEIIDLTSYPLAAIEPAETLTCEVTSVVLDGSNSSSSNSIEYHWTGPQGGVQSGQNTPTPTVILSGEYHLNVLDTANGCATGASVLVFQNNTFPIVNAGQDIELNCNETTAELGNLNPSNSNQYTYQWTASNPDANISDPNAMQVTVEGFGTYTLEVTNIENGCTASDEVNVLESSNVPQIINVQFQDPTCYGDNDGFLMIESVEGGTPPYTYTFNGATESAQTFYNNLSPGDYDVTIRDFYGCELSTSTTLLEPELVTIDLGENQTIDLGDSITIQPWITGAYDTLIWTAPIPYSSCNNSFPCLNPTFQPTDIINVSATVLNENGCWAEDLITIFVRKNRKVFIPSAFAPAGHTENQKFMIYAGQGVKKINQFQVFNRWGEKLYGATEFLPNDASYGWDGNFNGKKMSPGVYVYFAEIEFIDGIKVIYKGDVTLMR